jgi:hypothetical protein
MRLAPSSSEYSEWVCRWTKVEGRGRGASPRDADLADELRRVGVVVAEDEGRVAVDPAIDVGEQEGEARLGGERVRERRVDPGQVHALARIGAVLAIQPCVDGGEVLFQLGGSPALGADHERHRLVQRPYVADPIESRRRDRLRGGLDRLLDPRIGQRADQQHLAEAAEILPELRVRLLIRDRERLLVAHGDDRLLELAVDSLRDVLPKVGRHHRDDAVGVSVAQPTCVARHGEHRSEHEGRHESLREHRALRFQRGAHPRCA